VRQLVQTTLLLASLSLATSPELLAEDGPEEEPQSSEQEPGQDPPEEEPTESLRPTGASDWEADLDAMIEEAQVRALQNRERRAAEVGLELQETEDRLEESADLSAPNPSSSRPRAEKIAPISIGTAGGMVSGYAVGFTVCLGRAGSCSFCGLECFVSPLSISMSVLGGAAGGYLGHRIWNDRESDGERYSLLPYWDEERSGVMLSGRF